VRDLDVAIGRARTYLATLPRAERPHLAPLLDAWQLMRETRRSEMIEHLNGPAYAALIGNVGQLLSDLASPEAGGGKAYQVRRLAPRLLYLRLEWVLAYDPMIEVAPVEVLHELRIHCKRLRYALEFFAEALPPKVGAYAARVTRLQDHLGDLHDAAVAVEMMDEFLAAHPGEESAADIAAYRTASMTQHQELRDSFAEPWRRFTRCKLRKRLLKLMPER
jgi:CHAD domain-containing protein